MNGIHDMGGMHGMGPITHEPNEPVFHEPWERRVWGLIRGVGPWGRGRWGSGRFDHERFPPDVYIRLSYYERWFLMIVNRLLRSGLITTDELASGKADPTRPAPTQLPAPARPLSAPSARVNDPSVKPAFKPGQRVRARNLNPEGHTRLPRYTRGKVGTVVRNNGLFALQDTDTNGVWLGGRAQPVYTVRFAARELWGGQSPARDGVYVELWEDYLERA
jgi:nitrile hydratase